MSGRALRNVLAAFLGVQVAILAAQHETFFSELFRFPSRLAGGWPSGAASSLPLLLAVLAAAALWAGRPWSWEHFAAGGLASVASAGLVVYVVALVTGGLFPWVAWAAVVLSAALAAAARRVSSATRPISPRAPLSPFDGLSVLFLGTLLVPSVFPYIAYDAKFIWAWRAYAMRDEGFARAVTGVIRPEYPPLDSILLWLGVRDPLFEGRLLPWLLVVLFVLFFRARLARLAPRLAPPAALFLVATVHVWQGVGMYYADVPLMIFLVAGSLLALGLPGGAPPSRFDLASGALCLAAAVLVRPDGAAGIVIVGFAALLRARGTLRRAWPAGAAAAVAWASWVLRPAALRPGPGAYVFFSHGGGWREAGATPAAAFVAMAGEYLNSLQGQWLSHKGLGGTFWLVVFVALVRSRHGATRGAGAREDETRFYGATSVLAFLAVAILYLAIPLASDVRGAVAPDAFPTWLLAYRNFARVGMGRMVVHLVPFCVLYAVSACSEVAPPADASC